MLRVRNQRASKARSPYAAVPNGTNTVASSSVLARGRRRNRRGGQVRQPVANISNINAPTTQATPPTPAAPRTPATQASTEAGQGMSRSGMIGMIPHNMPPIVNPTPDAPSALSSRVPTNMNQEYSNHGTDSTAIAVIAFGGGPNLLEKLTLLEKFDATLLDKIKFEGCTPLATALISCKRYVEEFKEKICSTLNLDNKNLSTNTDCVMVTDSLPTELHNDFLSGNVSSPKDECQKFSKTYEKRMEELKEAIDQFLKDGKSSMVFVSLSDNPNQLDNIFRPEHKGYVLDIASMDSAYPVLADYYLHQKYISEMETIHKVTKYYLAQGKIIRGDDHPRAEIYQQLGQEWEINTGTNILALSGHDNKIINIYLTELKTSRSKVLKLHLDGKWRICRIIPKTETRGISNIEDPSKHEAYDIKITSDSGELYPAELIRKRRVNQ